jgi:hypothetical protein
VRASVLLQISGFKLLGDGQSLFHEAANCLRARRLPERIVAPAVDLSEKIRLYPNSYQLTRLRRPFLLRDIAS